MKTLLAALAIAASAVGTGIIVPAAQATSTAPVTRSQACDWHRVHRLDRYTTWQYVTPALARYEHIGRCSKVIAGQNQSVIIGQDGHVADVS